MDKKTTLEEKLLKIESLEHRMNHPMSLDEAEKYNDELYRNFLKAKAPAVEDGNNYEFEYDELMEYTYLRPEETGLPVDCFADDGGSWKGRNHPLWFLMKNGYGDTYDVIPFTVEDSPKIVGKHELKVNQNDINKVIEFIKNNKDLIIALGNAEIDCFEFRDGLNFSQYRMAESVEDGRLDEMSRLTPSVTGLPTDIWVDDFCTYKNGKHAQRMKFNAIQGNHDTRPYSTITLNDEPPIVKYMPKKSFLDSKDINEIIQFVRNNKDLLLLLADKKITIGEFKAKMVRNKNKAE